MSSNPSTSTVDAVTAPEALPEASPEAPAAPPAPVRRRRAPRSPLFLAALAVRYTIMSLRMAYLRKVVKMDIHPTARISLKAHLDFTNPKGVHIGEHTLVSFHAVVLTHDMSRVFHTDTYIGRNCFIGAFAIIMPGIRIGDECIIGSGSVVTKDVPANSIVGGNPARVLRSGVRTLPFGILEDVYREAVADQARERELKRAAAPAAR